MFWKFVIVIITFFLAMPLLSFPALAYAGSIDITVSDEPDPFNPDNEESAITIKVSETQGVPCGEIKLSIEEAGRLWRWENVPAGASVQASWDGRDNLGDLVAHKTYSYMAVCSMFPGGGGFKDIETGTISVGTKIPLIIIPGIMGSTFKVAETFDPQITDCQISSYKYPYSTDDMVWLDANNINKILNIPPLGNNLRLCGKYLDVLALQPGGTPPPNFKVDINSQILYTRDALIDAVDPIGNNIGYHDTLNYLEENYTPNVNLFIFPYDWRKDISLNIDKLNMLVDVVMKRAGTTKVNILAHSMGGLVARDYIRNPEQAKKIDTLVELGTPHVGAPEALAQLLYKKCIKNPNLGCLINGNEINKLLQNFPGVFELLPSERYYQLYPDLYPFSDDRDVDGKDAKGVLDYAQLRTFLSNLGKNMTLFDKAEDYHDLLDPTYSNTNGVKIYQIVGSGRATIGQIHDYRGVTNVWGEHVQLPFGPAKQDAYATNGDDTVPLLSATLGQQDNVYYAKQKHADLPTGDALIMAQRLLTGNTDIPSNLKIQKTPFNFKGKIVGIYSPAELHVYDGNGHHTGLTSEGGTEETIPDSSYDELGESKFIYLPDDGNYQIVTRATGRGNFDLKIKTYENGLITKEQLYLDVPQTEQTITSMSLNSDSPVIEIDSNGDGTIDKQFFSTSTLVGDGLADNDAPETSSQITGIQGLEEWYRSDVILTLTPQDAGSGILKTFYYFDGEHELHAYENPVTVSQEGTVKLWYFSVDKAGNSEEPNSVEIKIDKTTAELTIQFNPETLKLEGSGDDTLSGIDGVSQTETAIIVKDKAGNTTQLDISTKNIKNNTKVGMQNMTIESLIYNNKPKTIPQTSFTVVWKLDRDALLNHLIQTFRIKNQESIVALYNDNRNKSTVIERTEGQTVEKTTVEGLKLIRLESKNGALMLSY